jgi:hypothetical protein
MKSLILIFGLAFGLNFLNSSDVKELPAYNPQLKLAIEADCTCTGTFCSASTNCQNGGTCSCTCGVFTCSCTSCSKPPKHEASVRDSKKTFDSSPVSVSSEQYANIVKLANILKTDSSKDATQAVELISEMIVDLNEKKYENYHEKAFVMVNTLKSLSKETRSQVNNFLESVGESDRI